MWAVNWRQSQPAPVAGRRLPDTSTSSDSSNTKKLKQRRFCLDITQVNGYKRPNSSIAKGSAVGLGVNRPL
jgi:hypothetical protein